MARVDRLPRERAERLVQDWYEAMDQAAAEAVGLEPEEAYELANDPDLRDFDREISDFTVRLVGVSGGRWTFVVVPHGPGERRRGWVHPDGRIEEDEDNRDTS